MNGQKVGHDDLSTEDVYLWNIFKTCLCKRIEICNLYGRLFARQTLNWYAKKA